MKNSHAAIRPAGRVTLRAVAEAAGLHHSTVSLALRDSPLIARATREHVTQIARQLGYVPDPVLAAFNAYRQQTRPVSEHGVLAWLIPYCPRPQHAWRKVRLYVEYYEGACARARELGYRIEEFSLHPQTMSPGRLAQVLRARGIQGVLLCPQFEAGREIPFDFSPFSAVKLGYSWPEQGLPLVTNHHFLSAAEGIRRLRALGYRRVGVVLPRAYHRCTLDQFLAAAWTDYHQQPRLRAVPPFDDERWDLPTFRKWLRREAPEALLTDHTTFGDLIKDAGWSMLGRTAVASLAVTASEDRWAGIYQNNVRIGRVAVDLVSMLLHRNERGLSSAAQRVLIEGEWRDGPSAPPVAVADAAPGSLARRALPAEVR